MICIKGRCGIVCVFVLLVLHVHIGNAYKVLLLPAGAKSHVFSFLSIGNALKEYKHEIHMLVGDDFAKDFSKLSDGVKLVPYPNYTIQDLIDDKASKDELDISIEGKDAAALKEKYSHFRITLERALFHNEEELEKLEAQKYDLLLIDVNFFVKYFVLFAHRLKVPFAIYSDTLDHDLVRTPWLPSIHAPYQLALFPQWLNKIRNFDRQLCKMSSYVLSHVDEDDCKQKKSFGFLERFFNTFYHFLFKYIPIFEEVTSETKQMYQKYGKFDNLDELLQKSLLFLTTDDPLLDNNLPRTPNVINVGGLTTSLSYKTSKSFPENIQTFLDTPLDKTSKAKGKIIIVSLGSMILSYPTHLYEKFVKAFEKMKDFKFIWKVKKIPEIKLPSNVLVSEWIPQNDLMGHSSVVAFVCHAGNNGIFEALYHGVPMIALPIRFDQHRNAHRLESKGYGKSVNIKDLNPDLLAETILEVVNNPVYRENTKKASLVFKKAFFTPAQRAAYWLDHVLQFGGDHLKAFGNDLYAFQYYLIDVFVFILLLVFIFYIMIVFACRRCIRLLKKPINTKERMKKTN